MKSFNDYLIIIQEGGNISSLSKMPLANQEEKMKESAANELAILKRVANGSQDATWEDYLYAIKYLMTISGGKKYNPNEWERLNALKRDMEFRKLPDKEKLKKFKNHFDEYQKRNKQYIGSLEE